MSTAGSWQRRALVFGAIFDAAFALPMLLAPGPAARLLRIELPPDLTWFRLAGVLLLIVAGCYLAGASAEERTRDRVALVAGLGRLLGCAVLVHAGLRGPQSVLASGVVDGALGVVHLALLARSRPHLP